MTQVASAEATDIDDLLQDPALETDVESKIESEQMRDPELQKLMAYLESSELPSQPKEAQKVVTQALHFSKIDGILYFVDQKAGGRKRVAVPRHLREEILARYHGGRYAGHFSGGKLYRAISRSWWWPALYKDAIDYCRNCPDCAVVAGSGRKQIPLLHPIPVQ